MKHPEDGGHPPDGGASRQGRRHRKSARPQASADSRGLHPAAGAASSGALSASGGPAPGKKRRRRKRGHKVYARGEAGVVLSTPTAAAQPPHAAPVSRPAPPVSRPASGQAAYAALDLGTNNCRLLVAVPGRHEQFRVVDAFSRIVRLGEGLTASGRLGEAAMDRAVEALKVCAAKLAIRPIRRARLVATEACRSAANGESFLARVEAETGLELEIIARETEARLAVSGCGSLIERGTDGLVLFDIGGGSSEIALVDVSGRRRARLADHIVAWTSLPVGVVSLSELFGGRVVTPAAFEAMIAHVSNLLAGFVDRDRLGGIAAGRRFHLLGTSGTVTTLAGVHLGLERYERRKVDGLWLSSAETDAMVRRLLAWDFEARVANPCIGIDRADLVLAGCAILEAIRRAWPAERLRVADRGLREGILSELIGEDRAGRARGEGRET